MSQKSASLAPKPGWMLLLSISLHLTAVLAISYLGAFRPSLREATPYYVDIVSLPAIDPAPAGPEPMQAPAAVSPAQSAPPPPSLQAMTVPTKTPPAKTSPTVDSAQESREQEAREFAQKMSRLEHNADAKHQAEALAALQKRVAERKTGSVTGTGSDKGSDYGAYIQSRLKDALATTMIYQSKAPEMAVHLYIDKKGKLVRYVVVRPCKDKLFNDSVIRTIEKAKSNFPPTPDGTSFDKLFVFCPQEVIK